MPWYRVSTVGLRLSLLRCFAFIFIVLYFIYSFAFLCYLLYLQLCQFCFVVPSLTHFSASSDPNSTSTGTPNSNGQLSPKDERKILSCTWQKSALPWQSHYDDALCTLISWVGQLFDYLHRIFRSRSIVLYGYALAWTHYGVVTMHTDVLAAFASTTASLAVAQVPWHYCWLELLWTIILLILAGWIVLFGFIVIG